MAQTQPNVIWVLTDQQRAMMLSCNGDPNVHTPNIDALADMGVNFTRAVSGYPLCCPFRGSMLTSRYPHECVPGHEYQMPPEMPTIADVFNENGYHTAYFGKWHLDGFHEREGRAALHTVPPERRGHFQQWVGYENNNSQYDCWVHGGQGETAFCRRLPGYETDCLTDLLLEHLEERAAAKTPFFAVLSVQPPHDPYLAPPEYMARPCACGRTSRTSPPWRSARGGNTPGPAPWSRTWTGTWAASGRSSGRRVLRRTPTFSSSATTGTCTAPTACS